MFHRRGGIEPFETMCMPVLGKATKTGTKNITDVITKNQIFDLQPKG